MGAILTFYLVFRLQRYEKKYENIFHFRCKYSKKKEKIQPEGKNTARGKKSA